jgi:TolB-like protein
MFQVGLLYLGGAWALLEATDFFVQNYTLSQKLLDVVILLLVLGFPAALIIAWYHGEQGRQHVVRSEMAILTTLFVLAGIGTYRISTGEEIRVDPAGRGSPAGAVAEAETSDLGAGSVAILPFTNSTGVDSLDWLGPGVSDILTSNLAQLAGVSVVSPQKLFDLLQEEGREETEQIPDRFAIDIAARSGARLMARGSVLGTLGDLTLDAQLIDLDDGTLVGAGRARGGDLFALADTVARSLAEQVVERVQAVPAPMVAERTDKGFETAVMPSRPERSPLALGGLENYREYSADLRARWKVLAAEDVQGRFELVERYGLMPGLESEQRALLEEILKISPEAAQAYEVLAEIALETGDKMAVDTLMSRYAELEKQDGRVALSKGRMLEREGDAAAAREQYRRAVVGRAAGPALDRLANSYLRENRPSAVRDEMALFVTSDDPALSMHAKLLAGDSYVWEGRFDEALAQYRAALAGGGPVPAKLEDDALGALADVEALRANPRPPLFNRSIWRLLEVGRGQKALDLIDASRFVHLSESARVPPARYHALLYARGRALELLGEDAAALEAYAKILEHWEESWNDVPMLADLAGRIAVLAGSAAG